MTKVSFIKNRGFTLIELLVALTIITILAVAVYAALNPAQRLSDSKNARRAVDAQEILTAIHQSVVDNKGTYPTAMAGLGTTEIRQLGTGNAAACPDTTVGTNVATQCTGVTVACVNLMADVTQDLIPYLASMPIDPGNTIVGASSVKTGYTVQKDANGIVTIKACHADGTSPISVSR
jgi:prepilin-type N-terminal cleavage/methylation domain-containing protein